MAPGRAGTTAPGVSRRTGRLKLPGAAALVILLVCALPGRADARNPLWDTLPWDERMGLSWYRALAEHDHPRAMYRLGRLHEMGEVVERDVETAAAWYRRAARNGHADAAFRLGQLHQRGALRAVNLAEAARWYEMAAECGHAKATHNLAVLVERGIAGAGPDPARAAELYRTAAVEGVPEAWMSLGLLRLDGRGVEQDRMLALAMLTRAAQAEVRGAARAARRVATTMPDEARAAARRTADNLRETISAGE